MEKWLFMLLMTANSISPSLSRPDVLPSAPVEQVEEPQEAIFDSFVLGSDSPVSYPQGELNSLYDGSFFFLTPDSFSGGSQAEVLAYLIEEHGVKNVLLEVSWQAELSLFVEEIPPVEEEIPPVLDEIPFVEEQIPPVLDEIPPVEEEIPFVEEEIQSEEFVPAQKGDELIETTIFTQDLDTLTAMTEENNPFSLNFQAHDGFFYENWEADMVPISSLSSYYELYPEFLDFPSYNMVNVSETLAEVQKIQNMCQEAGVALQVICPPVYQGYFQSFYPQELLFFYESLANIVDFWDFSVSSLSTDPRYFYSDGSARNSVGAMILARLAEDSDLVLPQDFGVYITSDNASSYFGEKLSQVLPSLDNQRNVPILMYHHFEDNNVANVSQALFREHLSTLSEAGYESIDFEMLLDYVYYGVELPEKPFMITIDDGYYSNYQQAYPILQEFNMKASIFTIGVSVGKDVYTDGVSPIIPHFSYEEALEMQQSGLVSIQNHTYNMHQVANLETGEPRINVLQLPGESVEDYVQFLSQDYLQNTAEIEENLGEEVFVFAYPGGEFDLLSQYILHKSGAKVTLSTKYNLATVVQGLPESLLSMNRYNMDNNTSVEALLALLEREN